MIFDIEHDLGLSQEHQNIIIASIFQYPRPLQYGNVTKYAVYRKLKKSLHSLEDLSKPDLTRSLEGHFWIILNNQQMS